LLNSAIYLLVSIISFSSLNNSIENENVGGFVGGYFLGIFSTVASIGCLGVGIPVKITGANRRKSALREYCNQHYSALQPNPHFQINLYQKGAGIAYVF
jgi:hypothetical protein